MPGMNASNMLIKHTMPIRVGGLAAMVGGVAFLAEDVIVWTLVRRSGVDLEDESYLAPFDVLLLAGALAATASIAALYALDGNLYGWVALLTALVAFVGLGMEFVYMLAVVPGISLPVNDGLFYLGLFVGTLGLLALGILTVTARFTVAARVLPWWCGAALLAASPSFAYFLVPGPVVGIAWVLVGYAIFRESVRRTERPPGVR
jgi:hypothetical protein